MSFTSPRREDVNGACEKIDSNSRRGAEPSGVAILAVVPTLIANGFYLLPPPESDAETVAGQAAPAADQAE